jgi:CheY-like chemotaxis protein
MGYRAPVASALDLASALHEILPDVPILLATASADEITADTLLAAGVSAVVHLPLISAEIAWALARCLRALNSNELHSTETVSRKPTSALLPLTSRDRA